MQAQTMIAPKRQQTTTAKMLNRSAELKGYKHNSLPDAQKQSKRKTRVVSKVYPRLSDRSNFSSQDAFDAIRQTAVSHLQA
jgi:hypothetical protein